MIEFAWLFPLQSVMLSLNPSVGVITDNKCWKKINYKCQLFVLSYEKKIRHTWSKVENISSEQPKNVDSWFDKKSTEYFLLKRGNLIFCYTSDCCQLAKLLATSYQRCCDHDDTLILWRPGNEKRGHIITLLVQILRL